MLKKWLVIFTIAVFLPCIVPVLPATAQKTAPEYDIIETLRMLYGAPDQGARFVAMLYSVGVARNKPLVEALRNHLKQKREPLERVIIAYSAAAMSMQDEDIRAFFNTFSDDDSVFRGVNHIMSSGFVEYYSDRDIISFLLKLARDERYRNEASILALILAGFIGTEENNYIFEDSIVSRVYPEIRAEYLRRSEALEVNGTEGEYPDSTGKAIVWKAVDACMDSTDLHSRATAMLMSTNYCHQSPATREKLAGLRQKPGKTAEEIAIIDQALFACDWQQLGDAQDEVMAKAVCSLPETEEGVCRLLQLESETYKRTGYDGGSYHDNIVQRLASLMKPSSVRKLRILLQYGTLYIDPKEERLLRKKIKERGYGG